jgi:hypothetical protein
MVDEIERLEKDVQDMRAALKGRDAAQAIVKAQQHADMSNAKAAAEQMDAAVLETSEQSTAANSEVRAAFTAVEFLFHAIGCDQAFLGSGSSSSALAVQPQRSSSPLRSNTASLKMYTSSVSTVEDVRTGVTAATLAQFMGIIESRSADIIQQYVASQGGGAAPPASAALGPSRPSGRLKESLTSSTLVTALVMEAAKMELPGKGDAPAAAAATGRGATAAAAAARAAAADEDEDVVMPIATSELKRQAIRQLESDKVFRQVRASAQMASAAMTRNA